MKQLPPLTASELVLPVSPSCIVVSLSFGKDSFYALLEILKKYRHVPIITHHQAILEDWPGTIEYGVRSAHSLMFHCTSVKASIMVYAAMRVPISS